MFRKTVSAIMLLLLMISTLTLAFDIRSVKADGGTIYINADGSISPSTAPIYTADNITYTLTGNITSGYDTDGIVIERDNIVLNGAGYTVTGYDGNGEINGTTLTNISNVTVANMTTKNFFNGILLISSSNNTLSGNNVTTNNMSGIELDFSSNCTLSGNTVAKSDFGIYLDFSSNCTLSGNKATTNSDCGIFLASSSNCTLSANTVTASSLMGFYIVSSSDNNVLSGNNATANSDCGIFLGSSNCTLSGNTVTTNGYVGICLDSSNCALSGNDVTANSDYGIWLESSCDNNVLSDNNATANGNVGIYLEPFSDNNILSGNNATANGNVGIYLEYVSDNNVLSGNNVAGNNVTGIEIASSSNSNIVSGNEVTGNNIYGIELDFSSGNIVGGNNVTANGAGIYLQDSSSGNAIYHNNFVGNIAQASVDSTSVGNAWDNGYPSGGNYWSDYNGTDLYSGPYQNVTGSDGIGDTPYVIDTNNTDHYPLMNPISANSLFVTVSPSFATLDVGQPQTFNSTVSGGTSPYTYQWYVNYAPVSGATSNRWTFTPTYCGSYTVYLIVTDSVGVIAISNAAVTVNVSEVLPPSVSVLPTSVIMDVGQPQTFNSTVSGGTFPYTYQWCLNGIAVPGATSGNWTFTPPSAGSYTIYVNVTDSVGAQATSNTANVMLEFHDVALTNVTVPVSEAYQGWVVNVNVTVANLGSAPESFAVTLSYNGTSVATLPVTDLAPNATQTLDFAWNTTNVPCGNYTMQAETALASGEINAASNVLVDGTLSIRLMGDVNGVGKVDMQDVMTIVNAFGSYPSHLRWNATCDLNQDGRVDLADIVLALMNFGKTS